MKTTKPQASPYWILTLRALWYVIALVGINCLIIGIWSGYDRLATLCTTDLCPSDRLTLQGMSALEAIGLSPHLYALYTISFVILIAFTYIGVAALIFWARPHDLNALLVSLTLLLMGAFMSEYMEAVRELHPLGRIIVDLMSAIGFISFIVVCYTFPGGRFVPSWMRWPIGVWAAILIPYYTFVNPEWDMNSMLDFWLALIFIGSIVSCLAVQIYRYRWISTPIQRQQSRWVTYGLLQLVVVIIVDGVASALWIPTVDEAGTLPNLIAIMIESLSMMLVPLTIGASILRYRLWDIKVILNRTLVYVPLTTVLAGLYGVVITISQKLFVGLTGQKSDAAIVLTGFILTVTFTPLRNSLQSFVDKHFKETPDPMKTLYAFDAQVQQVAEIIDPLKLCRRLVESAILAYEAKGGAISLCRYGEMQLIYASEGWQDQDGTLALPVKDEGGETIGLLKLGGQADGTIYNVHERRALRHTIAQVSHMLRLTDPAIGTVQQKAICSPSVEQPA
jgi:hypothetical protein